MTQPTGHQIVDSRIARDRGCKKEGMTFDR